MKNNIEKKTFEKSNRIVCEAFKNILKCKICHDEMLDRLDFEQHQKFCKEIK